MDTNNPMDVSSAVHSTEAQTASLGAGALTSYPVQQNQGAPVAEFPLQNAENAPLTNVSGIEAELLFAHATGALSTNGVDAAAPAAPVVTEPEVIPKNEQPAPEQNAILEHQIATEVAGSVGISAVDIKDSVKQEEQGEQMASGSAAAATATAADGPNDANGANDGEEVIANRLPKKTRARKQVDFLSGGYFSDELSSEEVDFQDEDEDDEYDPDAEDEPQKKRGRPRLVETVGGEPRRKRGRPRKLDADGNPVRPLGGSTASNEADNGEPKVKRKRGRPRKIRPEELNAGAEGQLPAAEAKPAEATATATAAEGTDEVDLGPILMSNLNEGSIDPNLDPSLYSNADASVYSPLGSSSLKSLPLDLSLVKSKILSLVESQLISGLSRELDMDNLLEGAVDEQINSIVSKSPSEDSQEIRQLGQILDETLDAEFGSIISKIENENETTEAQLEQVHSPKPKKLGRPRKSSQTSTPQQEGAITPVKRGRGRPRKGEEVHKKEDFATLRRSDRRAVVERTESEVQKRVERALKVQRKLERKLAKKLGLSTRKERKAFLKEEVDGSSNSHSSSSGSEGSESLSGSDGSDDDNSEDDSDMEGYLKRRQKYVASSENPRGPRGPYKKRLAEEKALMKSLPKVKKTPVVRRNKKGRPSKQENVARQIFSIFKPENSDDDEADDSNLLTTTEMETQAPVEKQLESTPSAPAPVPFAINFDNKGESTFSNIPIISGVRNPTVEEKNKELEKITKYVPLPVPEVDDDGKIIDPTYAEKHLPGVILIDDDNASGRLIDERAFFLEGSEGYFEQHNLRFRPSASSLALNAPDIGFEEFAPFVEMSKLVHHRERETLYKLHKKLYNQFCFELSQGYSLNFFGVGSKTQFILDFLEEYFVSWYHEVMCEEGDEMPPVMVVNGYNLGTKLKAVLHDMTAAVIASYEENRVKIPKHVSEVFPFLVSILKRQMSRHSKTRITKANLVLVIHNIDGEAFRDERSQILLSQLALLPNVWMMVSTDNINLGLLWDLYRFKNFNFLWHDLTTYEPYAVEMSFKDVLGMGQSKKFMGSRGAKYVLASLTANAKKLYEVLLQLQVDALTTVSSTKSGRAGLKGSSKFSVELRNVYDKCVEKFIVSNEVNFKTMLGEYVEHKMCVLTKDAAGHEVVYVPFTIDEMAKIQQEEFS